jgi:hypothetical protein
VLFVYQIFWITPNCLVSLRQFLINTYHIFTKEYNISKLSFLASRQQISWHCNNSNKPYFLWSVYRIS